MADSKPEQEPSIEEILASIRQIISDDDAAPAPAVQPEPAPESVVEAVPEPVIEESEEEDVLELTLNMKDDPEEPEIIDEEPELESIPDIDFDIAMADINNALVNDEPEPDVAEPEDEIMPAAAAPTINESFEDILSDRVKEAAVSSMARLASGMPISKPVATPRHYEGVTLEDIVRDMLHPMLRDWMDDNLAPMVERIVQKELEKLARKAMDS